MGSLANDSLRRHDLTAALLGLTSLQHRNGRLGGAASAEEVVSAVAVTMGNKLPLKMFIKQILALQKVNHILLLAHSKILERVFVGTELRNLLVAHPELPESAHFLFGQLFEVVFDHSLVVFFGQLNHVLVQGLQILFWEEQADVFELLLALLGCHLQVDLGVFDVVRIGNEPQLDEELHGPVLGIWLLRAVAIDQVVEDALSQLLHVHVWVRFGHLLEQFDYFGSLCNSILFLKVQNLSPIGFHESFDLFFHFQEACLLFELLLFEFVHLFHPGQFFLLVDGQKQLLLLVKLRLLLRIHRPFSPGR